MLKAVKIAIPVLMWGLAIVAAIRAFQHGNLGSYIIDFSIAYLIFYAIQLIPSFNTILRIRRMVRKHPEMRYIVLLDAEFNIPDSWRKKLLMRVIKA